MVWCISRWWSQAVLLTNITHYFHGALWYIIQWCTWYNHVVCDRATWIYIHVCIIVIFWVNSAIPNTHSRISLRILSSNRRIYCELYQRGDVFCEESSLCSMSWAWPIRLLKSPHINMSFSLQYISRLVQAIYHRMSGLYHHGTS